MAEAAWTSAHLVVDGDLWGGDGDRLVLDVLAPSFDRCRRGGWADRFFFVRYSEGAPHLRFRLRRRPGVAEAALRSLLAGSGGLPRVDWVPYEAELERYGGAAGVAVSEELFHVSSAAAAETLAKLPPDDRSARLGKALLAMLAGLRVFLSTSAAAAHMSRNYGRSYLRHLVQDEEWLRTLERAFAGGFDRQAASLAGFVEAGWEALASGSGLPADLAAYRSGLVAAERRLRELHRRGRLGSPAVHPRWPRAVTAILPSYLHMHNNRLGVTITEECYLASLIAGTLEPAGAPVGAAGGAHAEPRSQGGVSA